MCARASNHFYDLPVLTSIVYSLLPHLVKPWSSSFLSEWRHHHLVSIHLLIAAGYADHLGPAWYLAFIMPQRFKRGLGKNTVGLSAPPKYLSAFTGDQVNPPEKRPSCTQCSSTGTSFFIIMTVCQHYAPCPLLFGASPFRCTIVIPAFSLDSLHIQSCQSSP